MSRPCARCGATYEPHPLRPGSDGLIWCAPCLATVPLSGPVDALTDTGNAERFADWQRHRWRYADGRGWIGWDGRRWVTDPDGALAATKDVARQIAHEAEIIADKAERDALTKHAERSESEPSRRRMLELAKLEEPLRVSVDDLDTDPWQLVVENGTIDLRTGTLGPHDPADLNTRLAPVEYVPGATHPALDRLLGDATGGDVELEAFLARALGYSITGDTGAEAMFVPHGPGGSGKSTLLGALQALLGDYAWTLNAESVLARRDARGTRDDLAGLVGVRLVVASEPGNEGRSLDAAAVKWITGGDRIVARHLYGREFQFTPQFKLWLPTNHRPRVPAGDTGMWRRLVEIPFANAVPEDRQDPDLKRTLTHDPAARSALLAFAVDGCLDWQRRGLDPPAAVRQATADYRAEQDTVSQFVADRCVVGDELSVEVAALYAAYTTWADLERVRPDAKRKFGQRLGEMGFDVRRATAGQRIRDGLALDGSDPSDASDVTSTLFPRVRAQEESYQPTGHLRHSRHSDQETAA